MVVLFATIILSWFPIEPGSGMASVQRFLFSITEPVLAPLRRLIPPVRMGNMALDLSPIIVFIGIQVIQAIIC